MAGGEKRMKWGDVKAEPSLKDENERLKSENKKLVKRIETLERMVDKLIKKQKGNN